MGTDVYLKWEGQTEEEMKKRYTGWSIDSGNVGYLRASIGMPSENAVLREVFPSQFWETGEYLEYDFKENESRMIQLVKEYLEAGAEGVKIRHKDNSKMEEFGEKIKAKFKSAGAEVATPGEQLSEYKWAVVWAKSLIDFFELGMRKQEEGKKPTVLISW